MIYVFLKMTTKIGVIYYMEFNDRMYSVLKIKIKTKKKGAKTKIKTTKEITKMKMASRKTIRGTKRIMTQIRIRGNKNLNLEKCLHNK